MSKYASIMYFGFSLSREKGSWHGWVDQNSTKKKTWPKVHFAVFTVCIVLTHDDDKMKSIHS